MENVRKRKSGALIWSVMVLAGTLLVGGCATCPSGEVVAQSPTIHSELFQIAGNQVVGVILLKPDGKIFAGYFRAKKGLVVCSHFDIEAMNKAKIPVAMSPGWATNTLKQEINGNIVKVNKLAAAKGVKVGMKVRDALKLLMN